MRQRRIIQLEPPIRSPAILILITAVSALVLGASACSREFVPDTSTPSATVRTYLGHLARAEPEAAYGLLSTESKRQCTRDWYLDRSAQYASELDSTRVVLRETTLFDSRATVRTTIDTGRNEPRLFNPGSYTYDATYTLVKEGERWLLKDAAWPYGSCDFPRPADPAVDPPLKPAPSP